jgi:hypothetical protein
VLKAALQRLFPIKAERHASVSCCRGDVRTDSIDDEIQRCLSDQFVSKAYRLLRKKDEKPFSLCTVVFTFEVPTLLTHIRVGYTKGYLLELMY